MMEQSRTKPSSGILTETVLAAALIAAGVSLRLATLSWPNFSPIAGLAIVGGLLLSRSWLALAVPLLSMALSDLWIGSYETPVMIAVYACLAWPAILGRTCRGALRHTSYLGNAARGATLGALGGLAAALVFFAVTNWAHWRFADLAPETLTESYVAALPFLRFTLAGDLLFGTLGGTISGLWLAHSLASHTESTSAAAQGQN